MDRRDFSVTVRKEAIGHPLSTGVSQSRAHEDA